MLVLFIGGCTGVGLTRKTTTREEVSVVGKQNTTVTNDPESINTLAWMLGGSVLLSTIAGIWYRKNMARAIREGVDNGLK